MIVGTGGLTLFTGTPLLEEAEYGEFNEKEQDYTLRCCSINLVVSVEVTGYS